MADVNVDEIVREVKTAVEAKQADFAAKHDAVKAIAEKALAESEKGIALTETTKELADQAIAGMNEAKARLDEMEQKMVVRGGKDDEETKTLGEVVTGSEDFKSFIAARASKGSFGMEVKAIISSLTTAANGSAGDLIVPDRVPGVVGVPLRRLTVRDLLTAGRTDKNSIQFIQETSFTNSAATVSETAGTTKAQSEIYFDIVTSNVTTIAHWVQATRQILDDVPMLQSYINGRLIYGLKYVEDNQLLNGAGTGTDLNGIYTQATASTANLAVIASPTKLDVLRVAILQASLANLPATGIVLHPTDWMTIETTKDSAGGYIVGDPTGRLQPRIWGLPVVETQAMTSGTFLTGAFEGGAQLFDRWDARVEISTEDNTNFRQNLVTILAEERLALAVYNTLAFVKGTFSTQITDLTS
jgi:HK97 family phage major capsid protein